jgi:hypothetical protein
VFGKYDSEFETIWFPSGAGNAVVVSVCSDMGMELLEVGLVQFSEKDRVARPYIQSKRLGNTAHSIQTLSETMNQNLLNRQNGHALEPVRRPYPAVYVEKVI